MGLFCRLKSSFLSRLARACLLLLGCGWMQAALAYSDAERDAILDQLLEENRQLKQQIEQLQQQREKDDNRDTLSVETVSPAQRDQAKLAEIRRDIQSQRNDFDIQGFFTAAASNASPTTIGTGSLEFPDDTSFEPDSILGLQTSFRITDRTDIVAQFVARGTDDWDLKTDWAFLRFQPNEKLSVRAGKLRLPLYLFSESLEVGFSYPWVRPPLEVYQVPITTYEGTDVIYSLNSGNWVHKFQGYVGSYREDNFRTNTFFGGNFTSYFDAWTFRLSGYMYDLAIDQSNNIPGTPLEDQNNRYYTLATTYDDGNWLLISEIFYFDADDSSTFFRDTNAGYLTLGYRFGNLLPHITYAKTYTTNEPDFDGSAYIETINDFYDLDPPIPSFVGEQFTDPANFTGQSYTLGARYDINRSVSLKLEWSRYNDLDQTGSFWSQLRFSEPPGPGVQNPAEEIDEIDLYSISLDAVF